MPRFELTEHGENVHVETVSDTARLEELCAQWRHLPVLAMDTEFERSRTFFSRLALVQVFDGTEVYLIDPMAVADLSALGEILAAPAIIKVFHSCSEDLEVLYQHFGVRTEPLFDTQMAAAFLDMGPSLGYARLVEQLLQISLQKSETRTDWLQRPLNEKQKIYAAQDVQYLLPIYHQLDSLLTDKKREWLFADAATLVAQVETQIPNELAYLRVKAAAQLDQVGLNRLSLLAEWREKEAQQQDIPRSFLLKDPQLMQLAAQNVGSVADMLALDISRGTLRKYASDLLLLLRQAEQLPESQWPTRITDFRRVPGGKALLQAFRKEALRLAEALEMAPELLANRKMLEYGIMRRMDIPVPVPRLWNPWREELTAPAFDSIFAEHSS